MGRKHLEITKLKISKSHMGMRPSKETLEKLKASHKGHKHSEEQKSKMSESLKKSYKEGKRKSWNKGKQTSKETRDKISQGLKGMFVGEKGSNWQGGITPINELIRKSLEYRLWRKSVFERDNYTCIWCGIRGRELHADHIKPFALFPELRFAIDNGRTLCHDCHKTTDTWGGKTRRRNNK